VPGAVLVAIWGLETNFGVNLGKKEVIGSIATLAFDCRRTEMFQAQLTDALRIVERVDLRPAEMLGHWAGDFGQTQLLPSSYFKYAVDFGGDGRRDLVHSVPDVLASTANYLKGYGWQRGQRWNEGDPNFEAIRGWNKAMVYARTIALRRTARRQCGARERAAALAIQTDCAVAYRRVLPGDFVFGVGRRRNGRRRGERRVDNLGLREHRPPEARAPAGDEPIRKAGHDTGAHGDQRRIGKIVVLVEPADRHQTDRG